MEAALKDLNLQDKKNISKVANLHGVDRSTLSRRFNGVTNPAKVKHQKQQLLTPQQEKDLVRYINQLTEIGIPPTVAMVRNFARDIAGKRPGNGWSQRFCKRHQDILESGYLSYIDRQRKHADRVDSYEYYFALVKRKITDYNVEPQNIYNMDEKGFSLGTMTKQYRIFTKEAVKKNRVLGHSQDSNREWITILATICADSTWCPPAIIFSGKTPYLQDSWVHDVELGRHEASFATSPNGWTNDALGVAWLEQVFDKATKGKARNGRDWRLLFVDGHGSHITKKWLDWCHKHHVLIAIYPPHSTHRLQPLDVSLFSPLATYYTQQLDHFIHQCQGLSGLGKRDFFGLFWPAFEQAFTQANIASGWRKTGLYPLNQDAVISQLTQHSNEDKVDISVDISRLVSNQSSGSSALSSISVREVRKLVLIVANEVNSKYQRKLENTVLSLHSDKVFLQREVAGLKATIFHEQKRRKRGKKLIEEFRAEEGQGALFISPSKIQAIRDLEARREQAKVDEQATKQLAKDERELNKIAKQKEDQIKRQQRVKDKAAKEVAQAAAKAAKEQAKEANNASKQLNIDLQSSTKKPRRQNIVLSAPQLLPPSHNIEVVAGPSNPASQRPSRTKRTPAYLEGYQL